MFFHSKEMSHIDIIWHCGGKAVIATSLLLLEVANIFSLTILRAFYDTNIYWKPSWDKWPWVDLDMSVVINNHMRPGMIKSRNIHILLSVMPLWTKTSIWCYSKGVFFCIPVVSQAWGCSQPNTYFTNDFPLVFQIRLETSFVIIPILLIRLLQIFAHTITIQLPCYVQNFVVITLL